jgi:hypothetical protein
MLRLDSVGDETNTHEAEGVEEKTFLVPLFHHKSHKFWRGTETCSPL